MDIQQLIEGNYTATLDQDPLSLHLFCTESHHEYTTTLTKQEIETLRNNLILILQELVGC